MSLPRIIAMLFISITISFLLHAEPLSTRWLASFVACVIWSGMHEAVNYFEAKK